MSARRRARGPLVQVGESRVLSTAATNLARERDHHRDHRDHVINAESKSRGTPDLARWRSLLIWATRAIVSTDDGADRGSAAISLFDVVGVGASTNDELVDLFPQEPRARSRFVPDRRHRAELSMPSNSHTAAISSTANLQLRDDARRPRSRARQRPDQLRRTSRHRHHAPRRPELVTQDRHHAPHSFLIQSDSSPLSSSSFFFFFLFTPLQLPLPNF